uniref:Uridine diphosphate glucose pyrophosphatase NUDT14 n=1 Tax=Panagrellus redivivus TaxID=6233 RepID=A0A7E4V1Z4_PANRE
MAMEKIQNIRFDDTLLSSPYMKPIRLHFERRGMKLNWDIALEHDSVACILYHRERNALLFVRQFRPPVFVRKVRRLPENIGKGVHDIQWQEYPISLGETLELCAGLMDKQALNPLQTMAEEIAEECGYKVPEDQITLIKKFIPSVSISGAQQYMYYAEIDDTMKISEGGGNSHEGEFIEKVFMTLAEAKAYIDQEAVASPPGFLFAVKWFLSQKAGTVSKTPAKSTSSVIN